MKLYNTEEISALQPERHYRKTKALLAFLGLLTFIASLVAILCITS